MQLDERTFLERFEARDLSPAAFDHRGHLWMAWTHLRHFPLDDAIGRVCVGIRELASRFGAPDKFNWTLTEALMRIMAARLRAQPEQDFDRFLERNPDLVDDARGVLAHHYSAERLDADAARRAWVAPDLAPIGE